MRDGGARRFAYAMTPVGSLRDLVPSGLCRPALLAAKPRESAAIRTKRLQTCATMLYGCNSHVRSI